jgi:hypothetical protein
MKITMPFQLSDAELVSAMTSFAGRERQATTQLIAHLAEFDRRRLYLAAGLSSLFMYFVRVLQLSEPEAYNRIEAARVARRFPVILDKLAEGSLSMTTVRLLASHLTVGNHEELLAAASGKSKREVDELLARHFPQPDVASSVRKLPEPRPIASPVAVATSAGTRGEPVTSASPLGVAIEAVPPTAPPRPAVVKPLAPERYKVQFTARAETCEKLRLAQDMLRHAVPTGDTAEIIDRALTSLLKELAKKKFAATDRPRASRGAAPGSRYVAAKVRRAVWIRDLGCCAYVAENGRRCNTRALVEFHHLDPCGWAARPRLRRSSFAVAPTTTTRRSCSTVAHSLLVPEREPRRRRSRLRADRSTSAYAPPTRMAGRFRLIHSNSRSAIGSSLLKERSSQRETCLPPRTV